MRVLLHVSLLLCLAWRPAGASPEPPPSGCAAVQPLPVTFQGVIEVIGPARWQVAGQTVEVTAATVITPAGPLPAAGGWASVTALWRLDGSLVATRIEISPAPAAGRGVQVMAVARAGQPAQALYAAVTPPDGGRVYFGGRLVAQIVSTAPEQWLLLTPSDDGPWLELRTVTVDRLAIPIDETAGPAVPGAWLEVAAIAPLWPEQPWTARSLRVDFGPQATVQGPIGEIGDGLPARWQVADTCVIVDSDAVVDGRPRAERTAIAQGTRLGAAALWARSAAVRYRFEGTLVARLTQLAPPRWVILVAPPAHVDALGLTRVYLAVDAASRIDPSLLTAVLGVGVTVQARAGQSGWLADWVDDPASPWQP